MPLWIIDLSAELTPSVGCKSHFIPPEVGQIWQFNFRAEKETLGLNGPPPSGDQRSLIV